jgi:hypothetical protein
MRRSSTTFQQRGSLLALAAALAGSGCINQLAPSNDGRLQLNLKTGNLTVNSVHWAIQTSATPPVPIRSGDIDVSDANAAASVHTVLPAGTGYRAILTADVVPPTGNGAFCTGTSTSFNVVAGQETMVTVPIVCGGGTSPQNGGSANINGQVVAGDNCPLLTSWMASALKTSAPTGGYSISSLSALDSSPGADAWAVGAVPSRNTSSRVPASWPGAASRPETLSMRWTTTPGG